MLIHNLIPHQHEVSPSDQFNHQHPHDHQDGMEGHVLHWLFDLMDTHRETEDESHHELIYTNPFPIQLIELCPAVQPFLLSELKHSEQIVIYVPLPKSKPMDRWNSDPPDPSGWSRRGPPALG